MVYGQRPFLSSTFWERIQEHDHLDSVLPLYSEITHFLHEVQPHVLNTIYLVIPLLQFFSVVLRQFALICLHHSAVLYSL